MYIVEIRSVLIGTPDKFLLVDELVEARDIHLDKRKIDPGPYHSELVYCVALNACIYMYMNVNFSYVTCSTCRLSKIG